MMTTLLRRFPTAPFRLPEFTGRGGSQKLDAWKKAIAERWSNSIVAPGLDSLYEGISRYGAPLLLFGSLLYFAWVLWTMDGSLGKVVAQ